MSRLLSSGLSFMLLAAALLAPPATWAQAPLPLTPDEAVALGLDANESILAVRADAEAAQAVYRQARAARLPSVSSKAGYTRLSDNIPEISFDTDFLPGLDTSFTLAPVALNRFHSELVLEQPIFTGLRLHRQIEAAHYRAEAALLDAAREEAELAFAIRQAYWTLYRASSALDATDEAVAQVEAHLMDVRNRLQAGAALHRDVLTVQTRLSEVRLDHLEAENAERLARLELNRLIGRPLSAETVLPADVVAEPLEADQEAWIDQALASQPALQALAARVEASEAEVGASRGSWFPQVALNGRYVYARPNQYFFTEQDAFKGTWEAGVALSWSIWDGGARRAETSEAVARLRGAEARLAAAREEVAVEVARQYMEAQQSAEAVAVAQQAVDQAEEVLRTVRQQYVQGAALSADVLDAEQTLRSAHARFVGARADYAIARAALHSAVGRVR